eukprot:gene5619-2726_t
MAATRDQRGLRWAVPELDDELLVKSTKKKGKKPG